MKMERAAIGQRTTEFSKSNLYYKQLITIHNLSEQNYHQNAFKIDLGFALKENSVRKDGLSNMGSLYLEDVEVVGNQFAVGNKIKKRGQ